MFAESTPAFADAFTSRILRHVRHASLKTAYGEPGQHSTHRSRSVNTRSAQAKARSDSMFDIDYLDARVLFKAIYIEFHAQAR